MAKVGVNKTQNYDVDTYSSGFKSGIGQWCRKSIYLPLFFFKDLWV